MPTTMVHHHRAINNPLPAIAEIEYLCLFSAIVGFLCTTTLHQPIPHCMRARFGAQGVVRSYNPHKRAFTLSRHLRASMGSVHCSLCIYTVPTLFTSKCDHFAGRAQCWILCITGLVHAMRSAMAHLQCTGG